LEPVEGGRCRPAVKGGDLNEVHLELLRISAGSTQPGGHGSLGCGARGSDSKDDAVGVAAYAVPAASCTMAAIGFAFDIYELL